MATTASRKLSVKAAEMGVTVDTLIKQAIRESDSKLEAARLLDVTPNTITYHLKRMGLRITRKTRVEEIEVA